MKKRPARFGYPTILEFSDKTILDYLDTLAAMSPRTAITARDRLSLLPKFTSGQMVAGGMTVDQLVDELKAGKLDRYQVMSRFSVWLKRDRHKSDDRVRKMVSQAKLLFEHSGIEFSERAFRSRVKLPRAIQRRRKTAVDRETIIQILQAASNQPSLQLCILWHAATGRRPSEIFSLRHCDIDLEHRRYRIRPEFSKMRVEDERLMTAELAARTESYLRWKHRPREVVEVGARGHRYWITRTPPKVRPGDLLFSPYRWDSYKGPRATPAMLYFEYTKQLRSLIDSMANGLAERVSPDNPMAPRKFTLYRLRDHAKTVIADLGYSDFSEWFIAHAGSTYYQQSEKKRAEVFAKIEPYLTYLDSLGLDARHADMESKLDVAEERYKKLEQELVKQQRIVWIMTQYSTAQDDDEKQELLEELLRVGDFRPAPLPDDEQLADASSEHTQSKRIRRGVQKLLTNNRPRVG